MFTGPVGKRPYDLQHNPFMVNRSLMYEIEKTWPADFNITMGVKVRGGAKGTQIEPITMSQNYAVDRGLAVNVGQYPQNHDVHTNGNLLAEPNDKALLKKLRRMLPNTVGQRSKLFRAEGVPAGAKDASFLQIQGPGWSSEYYMDHYRPRGDYHCLLKAFFLTALPRAAPWENKGYANELRHQACVARLLNETVADTP